MTLRDGLGGVDTDRLTIPRVEGSVTVEMVVMPASSAPSREPDYQVVLSILRSTHHGTDGDFDCARCAQAAVLICKQFGVPSDDT